MSDDPIPGPDPAPPPPEPSGLMSGLMSCMTLGSWALTAVLVLRWLFW